MFVWWRPGLMGTAVRFLDHTPELDRSNANGPGYPGPFRTWCSSLSTSVFAVVETMSSYSGRLSLCSLPGIDLLHRWKNGPGGIRTRICALTESCAAVAPRALSRVSRAAGIATRVRVTTLLVGFTSEGCKAPRKSHERPVGTYPTPKPAAQSGTLWRKPPPRLSRAPTRSLPCPRCP